ncbi:L-asparaginase isoform X1 [Hydra vulgaris]|uniref:asparaginase n=2 Tax=Hydra vulgaris TaxID=6087 RepID=A0ABM4CG63_HYDVU
MLSDYACLNFEGFYSNPTKQEKQMLHSSTKAKISNNPLMGRKTVRILVIYTGGTIGMKQDKNGKGYTVVPNYFADALKKLPMLYDEEYVKNGAEEIHNNSELDLPYNKYPQLVMPLSKMGTRVFYYLKEHDPILDSSNMSMHHWTLIANDVKKHYQYFDSFVILHGTDTMSYTASALSYMFENLDKTVILTGSQIPIFEQRNDGRSNFVGALEIAGHFIIPEVTLFFNNKLFRGNRTQKASASDLDAFASPNLPPLAKLGTEIEITWDAVFPKTTIMSFTVREEMSENVGLLRLFPGINAKIVRAFLSPPMEGIVIESFGAGNIPSNRPDLVDEFRKAAERNVLILNITQCYKGSVSDAYAAGKVMYDIGVIPGYDMTPEAALTKMAYVLGNKDLTYEDRKALLSRNLRGEMTIPQQQRQYSMRDGEFVKSVAEALRVSSLREMNCVRRALLPIMLTCAAKAGDLETIKQLISQGANLNEPSDYDGKTSLHLASAEGHINVVTELLKNGSSVYVRDRRGRTPLFDAIRNKQYKVVKVLLSVGAKFDHDDIEVTRELCIAANENDVERLRLWNCACVDMNQVDLDGRTPLHVAVLKHSIDAIRFLVFDVGVNSNKKDIYGRTPLESAIKLNYTDIINMLIRAPNTKLPNVLNERLEENLDNIYSINDLNHNKLINCKMNFFT